MDWECTSTDPGAAPDPSHLHLIELPWIPADVPGTAAGALRAHGEWAPGVADSDVLDGRDWWFRTRFTDPGTGPFTLRLAGLATFADVWLNGTHLLHSDNMFLAHECEIERLQNENELCIRFAALTPAMTGKRPRPRWKTALLRDSNLRWVRTTLLGRMDGWAGWAAPVGPWRDVDLVAHGSVPRVVDSSVVASCDGAGGAVAVHATIAFTGAPPVNARVRVGDASAPLELAPDGERAIASGTIRLTEVERWWPHTHGDQPRYPVLLEVDGTTIELTTVGFRTVEVDRAGDGFQFVVNDAPIFCRGAVWVPPDVVTMSSSREEVRASLECMRDAGMNMVRVAGHSTYESEDFWDCCDELGLLVWQDCMLAGFDPPETDDFIAAIDAEITHQLTRLQSRPALAIICGSSETYQRAAMFGREPGSWNSTVLETTIPAAVERVLPGIAYVASSPIGGALSFEPAVGVAHYFGVGAYERPLSDARLSGVRFASECLAFSIPPERNDQEDSADPKAGVPSDNGVDWDFADVRDFYVRERFGVDPAAVRNTDPAYAFDLGRAAIAEVMDATMSEWRHPGSRCAGGIVLAWKDLWPGAGWGLLDHRGRPKAPWYALRRALDPLALLAIDEGLSGLELHVVNDHPRPVSGRLRLVAYSAEGLRIEDAEQEIEVEGRSATTVSASALLGGFRDLTRAYRFGPPAHDVVVATFTADDGRERETFYFPLGSSRPRVPDVGLFASAHETAAGVWSLAIATRELAQWVAIDAPGFTPADSWFHLAPGTGRTVQLRAQSPNATATGAVRALNAHAAAPIVAGEYRPL